MILEQLYLGCLAQASYFIADETTGQAAVVDPRRDIDDYLAKANELGLSIKHVLLTHFHADFASGHLELMQACKDLRADLLIGGAFSVRRWREKIFGGTTEYLIRKARIPVLLQHA